MARRRPSEVRRRFRTLRVLVDLSQIEVSVRAKMSLQRYRAIENGYTTPSDDEAANLKRVLRVDELFENIEAVAS